MASRKRKHKSATTPAVDSSPTTASSSPSPSPPSLPAQPLVVIDGPNVAFRHSRDQWPASGKGIQLAFQYYRQRGYRVRAFVPGYFLQGRSEHRRVTNSKLLAEMAKTGDLVPLPPQDDDDVYFLHYAREHGGYIVTNDMFRDHRAKLDKAAAREFQRFVDGHVISFTFVDDDFLPNPAFKLPPAPPVSESAPQPSQPMPSQPQASPSAKAAPSSPRRKSRAEKPGTAVAREQPPFSSAAEKLREALRDWLGDAAQPWQVLGQELPALATQALGGEFRDRKAVMRAVGLPVTKPLREQITQLMDDEVTIVITGGRPSEIALNRTRLRQQLAEALHQRLEEGPCHLNDLGPELVRLSATIGALVANRRELMQLLGLPTSKPMHEQVQQLMGEAVEVTRRKGRPYAVALALAHSQERPARLSLGEFKQRLGERRCGRAEVPDAQLPPEVELALPFLRGLAYPLPRSELGNRFKEACSVRLTRLFTSTENLVYFINTRGFTSSQVVIKGRQLVLEG